MPRILAPSLPLALILLVVAVVSLGSLAYPLVTVPILRTYTLANATTSEYLYSSTVSSISFGGIPYLTSTGFSIAYNYLCDPASMACYPTQTYSLTQTLSTNQAYRQISQVTLTTQSIATGQVAITHTDFGMTPAYAAFGLSDSVFFLLAVIVMLLVIFVLVVFVGTRGAKESRQVKPRRGRFCQNCGIKLPARSRFCSECGSKQT